MDGTPAVKRRMQMRCGTLSSPPLCSTSLSQSSRWHAIAPRSGCCKDEERCMVVQLRRVIVRIFHHNLYLLSMRHAVWHTEILGVDLLNGHNGVYVNNSLN